MTAAATVKRSTERSVRLSCERCATVHRVRDIRALKPGMSASCSLCGAPFFVVARSEPVVEYDDIASSYKGTIEEHPLSIDDEQESAQAEQEGEQEQTYLAHFHGTGGSLFGIHLVNALLTLVTLGLYYYWAKVRVRSYLFSQTEFAGDRFAYHGNARELIRGSVKATLVFGIPYYALSNAGPFLEESSVVVNVGLQFMAWLLLLMVIPVAIVGARRYRLTRTSWRGIRFSFQGKAWDFMKLWLSGYLLTGVSLGLYFPYFSTKKQAFLTQHSYFGSEPFTFSGEGNHLFRPFLNIYVLAAASSGLAAFGLYSVVGPLLSESFELAGDQADALTAVMIPAVSVMVGALVFRLLLFPYSVTEQRYFWEQTSIGSAGFHLPITAWPFLKLKLGNLFLAVCTLGLAWPWITIRNIRFITDHLTLVGTESFDAVVQAYDAAPPLGEGLDGFLDTGFDLG